MSESFRRQALAELSKFVTAGQEPLPSDPWEYLTTATFTNDEFAHFKHIEPVQPFPDAEYLEYLTRQWQGTNRLRVEKSRDMIATWWAAGVHLHAALTIPGIYIGYQSKKLLDANIFLDSRFLFMWRRIPSRFARPEAYHNRSDGIITIKHGKNPDSFIVGVPEGSEQARQWKFAFYLWDEAGSTENQEKVWTAVRPALAGNGKLTMMSSAKGANNLFCQLGYDDVTG